MSTFSESPQNVFLPTLPSLLSSPGEPFIHRDLSWLHFNERVLLEAQSPTNPELERLKFLSITASNLDEFFMIRFSAITRAITLAIKEGSPSKQAHWMQIQATILETVSKFGVKQKEALDSLSLELQNDRVFIIDRETDSELHAQIGKKIFDQKVLPLLKAPEPFLLTHIRQLENLQTAALYGDRLWFQIPKQIPGVFVESYEGEKGKEWVVFFLDYLLLTHLGPAFRIEAPLGLVRLTRDADIVVDLKEDDPGSIPDIVRSGIPLRDKGRPARLQISGEIAPEILNKWVPLLRMQQGQIQAATASLFLGQLWQAAALLMPSFEQDPRLTASSLTAFTPLPVDSLNSVFDRLKQGDMILHHPYDSFDAYVNWIRAACDDPKVIMIQQTVYRMDTLSPVIPLLKQAAKHKKIRVIIELRARFDELNNLKLTEELRTAGIEVGFGFGKLKLHAKVALVTRKEENGLFLYSHLSTGNYNAATARQYEDIAILTANQEIAEDVQHFFDSAWATKVPVSFKKLVAAPAGLHKKLLGLIQEEIAAAQAGRQAQIIAKVNTLVDPTVIAHLYQASQAGVQVDLIVRGACSLIPRVKGLSDHIRVMSVVDRFLEHSRVYYFQSSESMYLSSADWMPRNFFSRLELAFPVLDSHLFRFIRDCILPAYLLDTQKSRELTPQGAWKRRTLQDLRAHLRRKRPAFLNKNQPFRAQLFFQMLSQSEYKNTALEERRLLVEGQSAGLTRTDLKPLTLVPSDPTVEKLS